MTGRNVEGCVQILLSGVHNIWYEAGSLKQGHARQIGHTLAHGLRELFIELPVPDVRQEDIHQPLLP